MTYSDNNIPKAQFVNRFGHYPKLGSAPSINEKLINQKDFRMVHMCDLFLSSSLMFILLNGDLKVKNPTEMLFD